MEKESYQMTTEVPSPESRSVESNSYSTEPKYDDTPIPKASLTHRIIDGFRRDPNLRATPKGVVGANGKVYDVEAAAQATADSPLARRLKGRHLQMIAIGGSIGMGLMVVIYLQYLRKSRHRSFRRLREIFVKWRSCVRPHRLQSHWHHAVLHCPSSG